MTLQARVFITNGSSHPLTKRWSAKMTMHDRRTIFCGVYHREVHDTLGESVRRIEEACVRGIHLGESVPNLIPRKAPLIYGWTTEGHPVQLSNLFNAGRT